MKRDGFAAPPGAGAEQVELVLARLEASRTFSGSARHRQLLRHLVRRMLDGDAASLKESVIAVELYGRAAASFDPARETIVRVEARRLRQRLADYYRGEGRADALRIELPVGSYVPLVVAAGSGPAGHEATRRARDLVERGEHFLRQPLSEATLERALSRFEAALREAPQSASAHVGLARAWLNLATGWYRPPAVASEHAAEALARAIALDGNQAIAHALQGAVRNQFELDWPAARRSFERALACAPQAAFVHSAYGAHLLMRGEVDAAERRLAEARRLDPQYVNTRTLMINLRLAQQRFDAARAELDALADVAPDSMAVAGLAALIAFCSGDADAAVAQYRRCCALAPDHPGCWAHLAGALAAAGRGDEARTVRAELDSRFAGRLVSPYVLAIVALRMGEREEALALLARAIDEVDPSALQIGLDPSFIALRGDARFEALVRRVGQRRPTVAATRRRAGTDVDGLSALAADR
jgi:tetratricopeptide (TPR) repeat protein